MLVSMNCGMNDSMNLVNKLWRNVEYEAYDVVNRQFTYKPFYKIWEELVGKWAAPHFPSNLQLRENEDNAHQ